MARSAAEELVQLRNGGEIPDLLLRELNAGKSIARIAREWKVTEVTLSRWIDKYGLRMEKQWVREGAAVG
jgi:DNA invertase Pin-like site-specific DNA recombinase